jgi:rubrerythrin
MSIIWTLKKIVDPVRAAHEEIQREEDRKRPRRAVAGDGPEPGAGGRFRCRVCGHEGEEQGYCPECLADTMEPCEAGPEG